MFLTVKQVAERLQVSLGTVYGAVDRGELKAHRFGRRTALRISEQSLLEYIDGCAENEPEPEKPTGSYRHLKI
jgi:excisionase family DNA binding protein